MLARSSFLFGCKMLFASIGAWFEGSFRLQLFYFYPNILCICHLIVQFVCSETVGNLEISIIICVLDLFLLSGSSFLTSFSDSLQTSQTV